MAEWSGMSSSDGRELSGAKMKGLMKSVQPINKEESIGISSTNNEVERIEIMKSRESIREEIFRARANNEVERDGKMSPSNTSQLPTRSRMKAFMDATLPVSLVDGENDATSCMKALSYGGTPKSQEQKLLEKPNLYLSIHGAIQFAMAFLKRFNLVTIEESNVGVVIISKSSFTSTPVMMDLVRMVEEAKRRSDFQILPMRLDVSHAELDDLEMQEHIRKEWDWMDLNIPGITKATDCAAAYEYIRSCDCMVYTGPLHDIQSFLDLVFDRIRGLILAARNTQSLRGITPSISMEDYNTSWSSKIQKVKENSPKPMMLQSRSLNDPYWSKNLGVKRKNKSVVDSDSDKGYVKVFVKGERISSEHTFETLPPIPQDNCECTQSSTFLHVKVHVGF